MPEGDEDSVYIKCGSWLQTPKWFRRCADRYPRSFAIVFGIALPLFFLDIISIFIGYWISKIESPSEIISNDEHLASITRSRFVGDALANFTALTPKICFQSYILDQGSNPRFIDNFPNGVNATLSTSYFIEAIMIVQQIFNETFTDNNNTTDENAKSVVAVNVKEMYSYMDACGDLLRSEIEEVTRNVLSDSKEASDQLTFNWNRCTPLPPPKGKQETRTYVESIRPDKQRQYYIDTWEADRAVIFEKVYEENLEMNRSQSVSRFHAWVEATNEASGREACKVNSFAGAMFWFTVMTTIGYGNATPQTNEGRTIVFTLGFLSILSFGGILSQTGYVAITIFDDAMVRFNLKTLTKPWFACVFWGLLYYAWMLVIAFAYKNWNANRLGEEGEVSTNTSYWFAYISTTTVGFGDFFIAPEVLITKDMFTWPAFFLIGFVCLASFIEKFKLILARHSGGKNLEDRLARERPLEESIVVKNTQGSSMIDGSAVSPAVEECPNVLGNVSRNVDQIDDFEKSEMCESSSPQVRDNDSVETF